MRYPIDGRTGSKYNILGVSEDMDCRMGREYRHTNTLTSRCVLVFTAGVIIRGDNASYPRINRELAVLTYLVPRAIINVKGTPNILLYL